MPPATCHLPPATAAGSLATCQLKRVSVCLTRARSSHRFHRAFIQSMILYLYSLFAIHSLLFQLTLTMGTPPCWLRTQTE
jgi:hypothetical protein